MYHKLVPRLEGMEPGSSSTLDQLVFLLSRQPELDHRGEASFRQTNSDDASDDYGVVMIDQYNEGVGQDNVAPAASTETSSWGLLHRTGNAMFRRDVHVERYLYGAVRTGAASANATIGDVSVTGPSGVTRTAKGYVTVTDSWNGSTVTVYIPNADTYVLSGDLVVWALDWDCKAWLMAGGSTGVRCATATANWTDGAAPHPFVACTDDATAAAITVYLPRTMGAGDPNVRSGAPVKYARSNDGRFYCVSDYMDDRIDVVKAQVRLPGPTFVPWPGWGDFGYGGSVLAQYTVASKDCGTYNPLLNEGGSRKHNHTAHTVAMTSVEVVTNFNADFVTCVVEGCTRLICVPTGNGYNIGAEVCP